MPYTAKDIEKMLNKSASQEKPVYTAESVAEMLSKKSGRSVYETANENKNRTPVSERLNKAAYALAQSGGKDTQGRTWSVPKASSLSPLEEVRTKTVNTQSPVSEISTQKQLDFLLPSLKEKQKTDLSQVKLSGYQAPSLSPLENVTLPSMKKTEELPTLMTDEQLVDKFLASDYKLTRDEEKVAERIIADYRKKNEAGMSVEQARALREQAADPNSYYNKIVALERKTNDAYAFVLNALNAVPFLRMGADKYAEKQNDPTVPTMSEALEVTRKQNPVSSGLGNFAGTAGTYAVGGKILQSVPVLSSMATKAGSALQKVPVLGKMGAERLGHVAADTGVDVALDTFPRLVEDLESGKSTGEAAWNAAKNVSGNFAMNIGSDVLGHTVGRLLDGSKNNKVPVLENPDNMELGKSSMSLLNPLETVSNASKQGEVDALKNLNPLESTTKRKVTDPVEKAFMEPDVFATHTPEQIVDMRKYLNSADDRIVKFANTVRNAPADTRIRPLELSSVSERAAIDIKSLTGIDASGNKVVIDRNAIEHIDKRHGANGEADHSMADDVTLSRMQYILDNYDSISIGNPTKKLRKSNHEYAPTVVFEKKVDGTYYVVEAVTDAKSKTNRIVSAYTSTKKVVDNNSTTKNVAYPMDHAGKNPPTLTSETASEITTNSNIPTPTADVNDSNAKFMSNAELNNARKELLGDRYDDVMRTSQKNVREESYARNVSKGRVEEVPEEVKNEFIGNPELYEVLSNKDTLAQAQAIYDSGNAESQIHRLLSKKEAVAIPLGNQIVKDMIASGRRDEAVELMRSMSNSLRSGGQFTQAAAIGMMRSDPKTAMRYMIRDIDDINAVGRKKFGKRWVDVELKDEEIDAFDEIIPGDTEAIKEVVKTVGDRVAKECPSTMWEKVVELSKVSMLLNPRTLIRNIVSNAMLSPVRSLTDRVSALGQHAIHLVNPDIKITQSIVGGGKEEKALAKEVWEGIRENIMGNSSPKYERGIKGTDRDKQVFKGTVVSRVFDRIFPGAIAKANAKMGKNVDNSLLETARNFTYHLLEMGDEPFVKNNFVNRLASYMKAQGIRSVDDLPEEAISLAAEEALKATFKDDNTLTKVFSNLKRTTGKVGEVVMPFTKTPANLAMRGIDYSPAGIVTAFKMARNGKGATEIMDHIAKNITGTAAIAAGYVLAKHGIISGALSGDKDEAAFQKQQGQQAYSIKVGDNYYLYDWAQPSSIPIILGVSIYQSVEESDEEARTALEKIERGWDMTKQAGVSAANSWMKLSPLQTIADIFDTSYESSVPENFINEVLEFPQRLIPATMGATARAIDPVQRQTYSSGHPIQTQINVLKSKVPYLSETLPAARDTWGNEIRRSDTTGEAAFAQFLNPGQLSNDAKTPIDDEIQRLFDNTGNNAVFPRKSNWKVGDTKLTNEQYSRLQRQQGEKSYELAEAFIGSDVYDSFSEVDAAEVLGNLYGYAKAVAEHEMFGKEMSETNAKLHRIYTDLGAEGIARYYAYKQQADTDGNGGISKKELVSYLDEQPLTRREKRTYFSYLNNGKNPY